jgi:hypothetical protein
MDARSSKDQMIFLVGGIWSNGGKYVHQNREIVVTAVVLASSLDICSHSSSTKLTHCGRQMLETLIMEIFAKHE